MKPLPFWHVTETMLPFVIALGVLTNPLSGNWNYRAWDTQGNLVARGQLTFRAPKQADGPRGLDAIGTKRVKITGKGHAVGPHAERTPQGIGAQIDGERVRIDLNQGMADDNIVLIGKLKGKAIEGEWHWSTFAGSRTRGKFSLRRP